MLLHATAHCSEVSRNVTSLAQLLSCHGVAVGHTVGIYGTNSPEWVTGLLVRGGGGVSAMAGAGGSAMLAAWVTGPLAGWMVCAIWGFRPPLGLQLPPRACHCLCVYVYVGWGWGGKGADHDSRFVSLPWWYCIIVCQPGAYAFNCVH